MSIDILANHLTHRETGTQFYAFSGISKGLVDRTNDNPSLLGRGTRIMYFWNEEIMILKLPSELHSVGHFEFGMSMKHYKARVRPGKFAGPPWL